MENLSNIQLEQGQKIFGAVLVAWEDVNGKKKSDNSEFHFSKVTLDLALENRNKEKYSKVQEFICEPTILANLNLEKYTKVAAVFEMTSPIQVPKLVKIIVLG